MDKNMSTDVETFLLASGSFFHVQVYIQALPLFMEESLQLNRMGGEKKNLDL